MRAEIEENKPYIELYLVELSTASEVNDAGSEGFKIRFRTEASFESA